MLVRLGAVESAQGTMNHHWLKAHHKFLNNFLYLALPDIMSIILPHLVKICSFCVLFLNKLLHSYFFLIK